MRRRELAQFFGFLRMRDRFSSRRQLGTTLLEALIAILVLSFGVLAMSRLQIHLRLSSDISRQRSEAVRLAQEDLEQLRAFSVIGAEGSARSYSEIINTRRLIGSTTGYASNTQYELVRKIDDAGVPQARAVSISVSWTDRAGGAQKVNLDSMISRSDPTHSGALSLMPAGAAANGANARSILVPRMARDMGNGTSVFKPASFGTVAFVFANGSGLITARCNVNPMTAVADLRPAVLINCMTATAYLLSGVIRFTASSPPNAAKADDLPLASLLTLTLTGGNYANAPYCASESIVTPGGDRYLAYHCAVYPLASGLWWGRSSVTPVGWALGTDKAQHRVCRYSVDLDNSGSVDTNFEHPASYSAADRALTNQNFLVIPGHETCPASTADA